MALYRVLVWLWPFAAACAVVLGLIWIVTLALFHEIAMTFADFWLPLGASLMSLSLLAWVMAHVVLG